MAALCRIRLLGVLEFALPGRAWKPKKYNKVREYLALHAGLHGREALIECLRPDQPNANVKAARNVLGVMLTDLRHDLEPPGVARGTLLITQGQQVGLNAQHVTTDVAEFRAALEQAHAAAAKRNPGKERKFLEEAVRLYRGELLPGCYEAWVCEARDDLAQQHEDALRRLAALRKAAGDDERPGATPGRLIFDDLPADLRAFVRAFVVGLSVLRGGFLAEAAAAFCEGPNAARLLGALERRGLIVRDDGGRFRLLDAARDASDRTLGANERAQLARRHAEWCVRFAEQAEPHLGKTLQGEWVERVEAERENLCVAIGWCLRSASEPGDVVLGARIVKAIGPWGLRHVPAETWDGWLRAALERAPDLPHGVRLVLTGEAVRCARGQGNHPLARLWLEHLRNFATENAAAGNTATGDAGVHDQRQLELVFTSLHERANTAFLRENLAECLDLHRQSLAVLAARDGDMRVGRAVALADMADALVPAGQIAEAERCCEESLALYRELGLPVHVAGALWRLGQLRRTFGQFAQAHRVFDECLALRQKHGSPNCIADCSREIGLLLADEGRHALARTLLEDALARYEQMDKPPSTAATRGFLGDVAFAEGDLARARPLYEAAFAFWQADEHKRWTAAFLWRLGSVACHESDHATARFLAREALTLYDASPSPLGRANTLHLLGTIARAENRFAEAEAHHRESLRLRTEMNNKPGVCASWESLANVWANQREPHDKERAIRLFAAADAQRAHLGAPLAPAFRTEHDHALAQLRHDLGNPTFDADWSHGHRLTWKKACSLAASK